MKTPIVALILTTGTLLANGPADYNAVSGYGTRLSGGGPTQPQFVDILPELDGPFFDPLESEVQMQSITLASEVNEGNGFTRLGFTLTLNNTGPGYYEECFIEWEPVNETWHGVQVGDAHGFMPDLLPNGTTTRPHAFEVRVPTAEKTAAMTEAAKFKDDPKQRWNYLWNQRVVDRFEEQKSGALKPFIMELHTMRIGDIAIATNEFELYTDYGVQMKARSPAVQTFIIQLTGSAGYLPTERAKNHGGYGAVIQSGQIGPDGGQVLVEKTVEALKKLW